MSIISLSRIRKKDHVSCWGTTCWACGKGAADGGAIYFKGVMYMGCKRCQSTLQGLELDAEQAKKMIHLLRPDAVEWKDDFAEDTRVRVEEKKKAYRHNTYEQRKMK